MTLTVAASQPPEPKEPPEVSQARQVLLKSLDRFRKEAPDMQPVVLAHPSLEALFPKCVFFVVRFRQFPVGRVPPQGLDVSNVFVVMPGKEPLRIGKSEQLQKFFRDQAQPVTEEKHARQAVQAWLVLLHELHQDGFYQFEVLEKEITVQRQGGVGRHPGVPWSCEVATVNCKSASASTPAADCPSRKNRCSSNPAHDPSARLANCLIQTPSSAAWPSRNCST
jgi:hypothetical protein